MSAVYEPDRSKWSGVQVPVESAKIYVEAAGHGPPLVCLHNFSANSRARFDVLLPMLRQNYTCYLVDLRGHGRSTNDSEFWTHAQVARDIIQVVKSLQLESPRFLAASSGAMAMLRVAQYEPDMVKSMVLDSATYRIPEEARQFYKPYSSLSSKLQEYYRNANEVYGPEYGPKLAGIFHDFRLAECDINQPLENLRKISSPTLFVAGDRDFFFPIDIPIAMHKNVAGSHLTIFPRTSHIVMESFPEAVANLTKDFFDRNP